MGIVFLCLISGWVVGGVYRKWSLNLLEGSFLINLGLLAFATYYVQTNEGNQAAIVYLSVSIAFGTFVGIVSYHVYMVTSRSKLTDIVRSYVKSKHATENEDISSPGEMLTSHQPSDSPVLPPVVRFSELREPQLEDEV